MKYNLVHKKVYEVNGEEKVTWVRVGILLEKDNGYSIKLDYVPTNFDGWLSAFPDEPKEEVAGATSGKDFAREVASKFKKDEVVEVTDDPINLDEIPF
jgi:hypothetical protein